MYYKFITNIFGDENDTDDRLLSTKLQDFLICIEMFLAAVAHHFSFPHEPYHINIPNYDAHQNNGWLNAFMAMLDISDVHQDIGDHIGVVGSSLARRLQGRSNYQVPRGRVGSEREYLVPPVNLGYQSSVSKNRYGAMNIVRPPPRKDDGFVQANLFSVNYPANPMTSSNSSAMVTSTSSNTMTTSSNTQNTMTDNNTEGAVGESLMRKSDSSNSDWINGQPVPNDFDGLVIKGLGNDHINYRNPNA